MRSAGRDRRFLRLLPRHTTCDTTFCRAGTALRRFLEARLLPAGLILSNRHTAAVVAMVLSFDSRLSADDASSKKRLEAHAKVAIASIFRRRHGIDEP